MSVGNPPNTAEIAAQLGQLLGTWWYNYDEWRPSVLRSLVTEEFAFSGKSDSGVTDYEAFIAVDVKGADAVLSWFAEHRVNSPYPLRHNSSNIIITDVYADVVEFASYIFVTKIVEGRPCSLSSGTATGSARRSDNSLLLRTLQTVLDTVDSVALGTRNDAQFANRSWPR